MLEVDHQQAFDLGEDLLIAEDRAADCPSRAGCHTGAAALAERRVDFGDHAIFVEEDGVERAQVVADAAAGAFVLVDAGAHRFQGDLALLDASQDAGGGRCALRRRWWGYLSDPGHSRR